MPADNVAAVKRHRFKSAFFGAVVAFGLVYGKDITVADQVSIVEGVKNSAAILFGVVAAWMALVYPDELKHVLKPDANQERPRNSTRLFKAFYIASGSLLLAIIFPTLILLPSKLLRGDLAAEVGRLGLALTLVAVFLQVWALALVVLSTESLRAEAATLRKRVQTVQRLLNRKK